MLRRNPNQYIWLVACVVLVSSSAFCVGQQATGEKGIDNHWSCLKRKDLLRDSHGRPRWLNSTEIMDRVLKRQPVERPGPLGRNNLRGVVRVRLLIDRNGRVVCAKGVDGHPMAIAAAIHSLRAWTFKPHIVDGKPKSVAGIVAIPYNFSSDRGKQ